ncbi:MAG: ABC transporter permease [Actinomycetota bacterium]
MSAEALQIEQAAADLRVPNPPRKRWTRHILPVYTVLVILYLCFPIFVMILYSFNNTDVGYGTSPRVKTQWLGFTTTWYKQIFELPDLTIALKHTLFTASVVAVVAAALGTFLGLSLGRYKYRGKTSTDFLLFLNISSPEVVLGAALAGFFVSAGLDRGWTTIFLSHVMFCIPFVAVTVRARVQGLDRSLENAAMDLGATPTVAFIKVTLPLIFPGIVAGAMLAFALSIDDFVITNFTQGSFLMFPTYVYAVAKVGIPPQAFVMATIIFVIGVLFAVISLIRSGRKAPVR